MSEEIVQSVTPVDLTRFTRGIHEVTRARFADIKKHPAHSELYQFFLLIRIERPA